jgi:2-keto-3-deoxy-L-rhamnonate aldolase RhmA
MLTKCLSLKQQLQAGDLTVGAWLTFYDTAVAELMAGAGFDWIIVDAEHAPFSLESLASIVMAFDSHPTVPLIRVVHNDPVLIKQCLDLGFGGVLVPQVNSPEEAQRAVRACQYPPDGNRGFGPRRASAYGKRMDEYINLANRAILVGVQIETIGAVQAVRSILSVPGIDFVLLGPMDLAASMNRLSQPNHPDVIAAMDKVVAQARDLRLPVGMPLPADAPLATVTSWIEKGCRFVVSGLDQGFLTQAMQQALVQMRRFSVKV